MKVFWTNDAYLQDKARYAEKDNVLFYLRWFRVAQNTKCRFLKCILKLMIKPYETIHGIEIPIDTDIKGGLFIGHPYNITINRESIIGKNVNIHKGVTIGKENRGKRKGAPIIGSSVWIGINSTVVGHVHIGDDVLIAPNTLVNIDVPSHSIVIGSPCKIVHKDYATIEYVNNLV